jgi:hypothetical protein
MKRLSILVVAVAVAACGSTNSYLSQKTITVEYYRIFDLKTTATRQEVAKAASAGLGRNASNAREAIPIPASGDVPERPGRFKLVNPLEGTRLAALAGAGGGSLGFRVATCEGASWTANAVRQVVGSDKLNLTACLYQYREGYHLNFYAVFQKQEGGIYQISRDAASAMVGTPEQWTEKTFLDVVRTIRAKTGAEIALLEAQPDISGTPWLDSLDAPK